MVEEELGDLLPRFLRTNLQDVLDQAIAKFIAEHDALLLLPVELADHFGEDVLLNGLLNLQLEVLIVVVVELEDHVLPHKGSKLLLVFYLVDLIDLPTAVLAKDVLPSFVNDQPEHFHLWRLRLYVKANPELRQVVFHHLRGSLKPVYHVLDILPEFLIGDDIFNQSALFFLLELALGADDVVAGEALHMRAQVIVVVVGQVAGVADKGFVIGPALATRVAGMQTF